MSEQVIIEQAAAGAVTEATATLTPSTDHTLAAENHERDKLTVSADTADVWVSEGTAAAVLHKGLVARAAGDPLVIDDWKGAVHCISTGAAVIAVNETSFQSGDGEGERPAGADSFVPSGPSDTPIPPPTAPPPGVPYPPNA